MVKGLKRKLTDVHESNAGTSFHILWAIQKCLKLINFGSDDLKSIAMEGIDPKDAREIDPEGGELLAVDLSEYYGGSDFRKAKRIVISQLKYSTRHPKKEWTAFSICQGKKGTSGSIIHRLATTYSGFIKKHNINAVLSKTIIQLVSNRPASPLLQQLADKAKQLLITSPNSATVSQLKKQCPKKDYRAIEKMHAASLLASKSFIQFLSMLDFSNCESDSRAELRTSALQSIAAMGSFDADQQLSTLETLVFSKAQPESKDKNRITVIDILTRFNISQLSDLFPVSSDFEVLRVTIARTQSPDLRKAIIRENGEEPICIHGEGGIGKSTFVKEIPGMLPAHSECILFDCYGSGAYLNKGDDRHLHRYAFLQLSNELALKTQCPFLLERRGDETEFLRQFRRRLDYASKVTAKRSKNALLVIVIDAADNSVTAAEETGEKCFVHDLIGLKVPVNVRLVFTFRSHRKKSLQLPEEYVDFPILPFDDNETKVYLTARFPKQTFTPKQVAEFRSLTRSIPRVMAFTLGSPGNTLSQKLKPLRPGGKDLEAIFKMIIEQARRKSGNRKQFNKVLQHAIVLPRPVPVKYLADTTDTEMEFILDSVNDLGIAMTLNHNLLGFNNEDFETYIRDHYGAEQINLDKIASYFKANADKEEYASLYLGRFLARAGRNSELENIVLNREFSKLPEDPIRNREMFIDRAMLAMRHTVVAGNMATYLKLQIVAAEASKENHVLENLMIGNPDLANTFGNGQSNHKLYFQKNNPHWFGRVHLRSAALFSRNPQKIELAKKHMESAAEWINFRNDLPDDERGKYDIDDNDLACGTEAILRIAGPKDAANWLDRWNPKELLYHSIEILVTNLIKHSAPEQIKRWCNGLSLRFDVKLQINRICFGNGIPIPFDNKKLVPKVQRLKHLRSKILEPLWISLISLVEQLCYSRYNEDNLKELLDFFQTTNPENKPNFYTSKYDLEDKSSHIDLFFRIIALKKLFGQLTAEPEDLLPARLKERDKDGEKNENKKEESYKDKEYRDRERRNFLAYYKHMLPSYELLAHAYGKKLTDSQVITELNRILSAYEKDTDLSYYYRFESQHLTRFLAVKLLDLTFFVKQPSKIVTTIMEKVQSTRGHNIDLLLSMTERLAVTANLSTDILKILALVDQQVVSGTFAASTQIDYYVRAAVAGNQVTAATGQFYFDKVIEAAKDIDFEAFDQIKSVYQIIRRDPHYNDPELSFDYARYVEFCSVKLKDYEDFPWDPAVAAIGQLDSLSILAITSRWDHRNTRKSYKDLPELFIPGVEAESISPGVASALLAMTQYYWDDYVKTVEAIIIQLNKSNDQTAKNRFVRNLTLILTLQYDTVRLHHIMDKIINLLEKGGYQNNSVFLKFKSYCQNLDSVRNITTAKEAHDKDLVQDYHIASRNDEIKLSGVDLTDAASIEAFIISRRKKQDEEHAFDYMVGRILNAMLEVALPAQYVGHLDALVSLPTSLLDFWTFQDAIAKRLDSWAIYPEVIAWKKRNFAVIVKNRFFNYIQFDSYYDEGAIFKLAKLCEVSFDDFAEVVIQSLPNHAAELSANALIRLLEITTLRSTKPERQDFLRWVIARWGASIKPDFGDGAFKQKLAPPSDVNVAIGHYIRYYLGHPDKRIRWRAARAVVQLVTDDNLSIFKVLIDTQNDQTNFPFQDKHATYYWIGAKVWLWIAIHKLCIEHPVKMIPYAKEFYYETGNDKVQHVQILLFIKQSCLALEHFAPGTYAPEELAIIRQMLVSQLTPVEQLKRQNKYENSQHKTRFPFDNYDTVDHWYRPLGERFHLSGYEIAQIADEVICDEWGFNGDLRNDNYATSDEQGLMSHYKFDIPTIEDLRNYYEYNAMQCVAAKLIKTVPTVANADYWTTWEEWLNEQGLIWKDTWLADLKDPVPAERLFWVERSTREHWQWNVQTKDFDRIAGVDGLYRPGHIVVNGSVDIHYGRDHERQEITSALVEPKFAAAAMRAFQTMESNQIHLPLEKDEDGEYEPLEDEEPKIFRHFSLTPWLQSIGPEHSGIDEFDEDSYDLDKRRIIPGNALMKWSSLTLTNDKRHSLIANDPSNPVTLLETWSNVVRDPSHSDFYSKGQRLFIRFEKLKAFLAHENRALILFVELYRSPESRDYSGGLSYYHMIYIIYPNGEIKTLNRDIELG